MAGHVSARRCLLAAASILCCSVLIMFSAQTAYAQPGVPKIFRTRPVAPEATISDSSAAAEDGVSTDMSLDQAWNFLSMGRLSSSSAKSSSKAKKTKTKNLPKLQGEARMAYLYTKKAATTALPYNGGPVMSNPVNVYIIYYGGWSSGQQIIEAFINSLSDPSANSPSTYSVNKWWNINLWYYRTDLGGKKYVSPSVAVKKVVYDSYSYGTSLSDTAIWNIVKAKIANGQLPQDPDGAYFVLTSPDVTATSGFCSQYCGWHTYNYYGSTAIKYSFVGNPQTRCLNGCAYSNNRVVSPNNNPGVDALISVLGHELAEMVTDPQPSTGLYGWMDSSGNENADICAWNWGDSIPKAPNGADYNLVAPNGYKFMVQSNWDLNSFSCRMAPATLFSVPSPPPTAASTPPPVVNKSPPPTASSPPPAAANKSPPPTVGKSPPPPAYKSPPPVVLPPPPRFSPPPPTRFAPYPPPPNGPTCKYPGYRCSGCTDEGKVSCGCTSKKKCVNTCAYYGYNICNICRPDQPQVPSCFGCEEVSGWCSMFR